MSNKEHRLDLAPDEIRNENARVAETAVVPLRRSLRRVSGLVVVLGVFAGLLRGESGGAETDAFLLRETNLVLRQVDLGRALRKDQFGYPRIDPSLVDLGKVVERRHKAAILENRYIRVVLLPEMGRVYSLFDRVSGHEQLWTNAIARPLFGQKNDLEWWMVWGGVEYTIPRGEHGTTWALPWTYEVGENSRTRKAVRMRVVEPKTRLHQAVEVSLAPDSAAMECEILIENKSSETVRFSHWVNPMWAPGGRGELTARTEFIVPTEKMLVADRDFNRWMLGERVQPWRGNPLRFAENWRDVGDLLAVELTNGFYSAFSHEANEGVARVFDLRANRGLDIWTWGFPPPAERQKQYSLTPNAGYVEMWGGTVRDFRDESLQPLGAGETVRWVEWMFPYRGTAGLTAASKDLAVNFVFADASERQVQIAICPVRWLGDATLKVTSSDAKTLWQAAADLRPESTFRTRIELPKKAERPELSVTVGKEMILRTRAESAPFIQWGSPYFPRNR